MQCVIPDMWRVESFSSGHLWTAKGDQVPGLRSEIIEIGVLLSSSLTHDDDDDDEDEEEDPNAK